MWNEKDLQARRSEPAAGGLRTVVFSIALLLVLAPGLSGAQDDGVGLGFIAGEPTGISLKLWSTPTTALDFATAWSLSDENSLHLHVDYLIHRFGVIDVEKGRLPVYYGIGGRVKIRDDDGDKNKDDVVGIRFPVGMTYLVQDAPFDIFLEVVPILDVAPDTELDFNAAVGARYWF
jgi:hypothetical protein